MKATTTFALSFTLLSIIGLIPLSSNASHAQSRRRTGTGVRGEKVQPDAPNSVANPSPTAIPSPSKTATRLPERESSIADSTRTILHPEPIKPEPIATTPKVEVQRDANAIDPDLERSYIGALREYYSAMNAKNQASVKAFEYNNWAFEHRKKVFSWQLSSGRITFGVVILLVMTGVFFSGIQFFIAMKRANRRKKSDEVAKENEVLPTTLKASLSGIEVSSSILGVIILMVSFLFFYLYLVHVYPITVISE